MNDWREDGQAAHQLQLEREEMALHALMQCKRAGSNLKDLETLAVELGLRREWQQYQATTQP